MFRVVTGLLLLSSWINASQAAETRPFHTPSENTQRHAESPTHAAPIPSPLTESAPAHRQQWGLSEAQWQRYAALMQGIRGSLSPATLSPIEVLGIHAQDDAERRRYAERWAEMLYEDTERILAFQREYQAAWRRLYPNLRLFSNLPARTGTQALHPSERLLFFTRPDCPRCSVILKQLLSLLQNQRVAGLDIYVLGIEDDDQAVRDWATAQGIEQALVHSRTVTLNHDNGTLARLVPGFTLVPHVLRQQTGGLVPVDLEDL